MGGCEGREKKKTRERKKHNRTFGPERERGLSNQVV